MVNGFREAMRAAELEPPEVIEPGRLHRFSTNGKFTDKAGWCRLFPDLMGGVFGDYRTGLYEVWQAKRDKPFSAAEREEFKRHCEEEHRERDAEQERLNADTAKSAEKIYQDANGDPSQHPYALKKGVPLGPLVRRGPWPQNGWEDALLAPLYDTGGLMWTLEAINIDGEKKYLSGGKKRGMFHPFGEIQNAIRILICEGIATGAAVFDATKFSTIVAMDTSGLKIVAQIIRKINPNAEIVILADNDINPDGTNPGLKAATEAARAIGAVMAVAELDGRKCDFWDVWHERGPEAVEQAVANAKRVGAETEKGETPPDDKEPVKENQAGLLVKLAEGMTLFHDEFHEAYSTIGVNGHNEILRCRSKNFRRYLAYHYYNQRHKPPSNEALTSALGIIEAKALFDGEQHPLHNRVTRHDGSIWYDLSDQQWRAIKLTEQGWGIVDNPPILFRRYSHQAPQVEPVQGGSLDLLNEYVNLTSPALKLFKVTLCSYFFPDIPHPILHAHGEHGAGKTFQNRVARSLVDPSQLLVLGLPRDDAGLAQLLSHHYFAPFDNLSEIQPWISDILCRAVTGEGFTKRELYSDDDDVIYKFRRCIGLNGINIAATKTDLMDRLILFEMDRIGPESCKEEKELWEQFEDNRAKILGAMFDTVVKAMQIKKGLVLKNLPRMADFAVWGEAISQALGNPPDEFTMLYGDNIRGKNEEVVRSNLVAAAIMELMKNRTQSWEGTATQLLTELQDIASVLKFDTKDKSWPKAPNALTRKVREILSSLRGVGVGVLFDHSPRRTIEVCKIPSTSSEPINMNNSNGFNPDGIVDGIDVTAQYRPSIDGKNTVKKQEVDGVDGSDDVLHRDEGWEEPI